MSKYAPYCQDTQVSPEVRRKLHISYADAQFLTLRDIKCPYCGFLIEKVFSDVKGHKMVYCRKCKTEYVIDFALFRRVKPYDHSKYSSIYPRKRQNR